MRAVIAGGGTAGHVNPALALARELHEEAVFIGTERGAEARLVPDAGFPLELIEVKGFDRSKPLSIFATGMKAVGAVNAAGRLLQRLEPSVVVGMGGYVSLPVCLAAARRRIPIVLHEQNIVLGLAHRVSKPFARKIATSFEETLEDAGSKGVFVGNPVAPELVSFDKEAARRSALERFGLKDERRTLLVFGGSQGATRINEAATGLVDAWADRGDLQVLHIAGRNFAGQLPSREGPGLIYRSVDYVAGMQEAYAVADLALCRGGATTVAELTVVGVPAIIVPYPYHRDRQQERHGRVLESAGAGRVLLDKDTTTQRVATDAGALLQDRATLASMEEASKRLGRPHAARELATLVRKEA